MEQPIELIFLEWRGGRAIKSWKTQCCKTYSTEGVINVRIYGLFVFAEVKSFVCLHSDSLEAINYAQHTINTFNNFIDFTLDFLRFVKPQMYNKHVFVYLY